MVGLGVEVDGVACVGAGVKVGGFGCVGAVVELGGGVKVGLRVGGITVLVTAGAQAARIRPRTRGKMIFFIMNFSGT